MPLMLLAADVCGTIMCTAFYSEPVSQSLVVSWGLVISNLNKFEIKEEFSFMIGLVSSAIFSFNILSLNIQISTFVLVICAGFFSYLNELSKTCQVRISENVDRLTSTAILGVSRISAAILLVYLQITSGWIDTNPIECGCSILTGILEGLTLFILVEMRTTETDRACISFLVDSLSQVAALIVSHQTQATVYLAGYTIIASVIANVLSGYQ
jgi:hypothetical protein